MYVRFLLAAVISLLLAAGVGLAQTPEIQKQIDKKLGEQKKTQAKKETASLEELLSQALKNNPDIRVAESKLHEAEAELYRARMRVFNRIVTLQQEVKALKAEADRARDRYEQVNQAYAAGATPQTIVIQEASALQKARTELARAEADLDLHIGKHTEKAAKWLAIQPDGNRLASGDFRITRVWDLSDGKVVWPNHAPAVPIAGPITDKIIKAMDTQVTPAPNETTMTAGEILDKLRMHTKGINLQVNVKDIEGKANLLLNAPIPLGAFYQWAEDQFSWRFVVRDYGIVVTDKNSVPPGGTLLLDLWRNSKVVGGAP